MDEQHEQITTHMYQGLIPSWTCICGQCHEQVTYYHEEGSIAPFTRKEALYSLKQQGWTQQDQDGSNRWLCRFCSLCSQVEAHLAALTAEERRILLDPFEEPVDVAREARAAGNKEKIPAMKGTFEVYRAGKRIPVPAEVVLIQGKRALISYLYHGTYGYAVQRWLRKSADYARFTPLLLQEEEEKAREEKSEGEGEGEARV